MRKTTVYLPEALKARVERVAQEQGRSEADLIRTALEQYTAGERPRPRLPLFESGEVEPIENFDEAMKGFGED